MIDYPFIPNNRGKQINIRVPIYLEWYYPLIVIKVVCARNKKKKVFKIRKGTHENKDRGLHIYNKRMLVLICVFLSKSFVS